MKRLLWFVNLFILVIMSIFAQTENPVVMTVNGRPVYRAEFEISYKKNVDLVTGENKSGKNFLRSYIDYQLALEEAYSQKMDTASDFRYQRSVYYSSVAAEYMQDKAEGYGKSLEQLVDFLKQDVELNHILIPFESEKVFPADTLRIYKKAIAERKRLLGDGFKGDLYIDNTENRDVVRDYSRLKGYLGWVVPGMLPPAVDKAMYSLSEGEISAPIRTSRGYHIVQVLNRRPAEGGRRVDHIYFAFSQIPPTQNDVDSVMNIVGKLLGSSDVNFDVLCQSFSEAYKTGDRGCSFAPFGLNAELPASFVKEAYKLKNKGDVSKPVVSNTGVHLMRLVEKLPLMEDAARSVAEQLVTTKGRMFYILQENHKDLFEKYNLKVGGEAYRKIERVADRIFPTDSLFVSSVKNKQEDLFSIEDSVVVKVEDFTRFLVGKVEKKEKDSYGKAMERFFGDMPGDPFNLSTEKLDWLFSQFALQVLREHVYKTLEQRYPEMKGRVDAFASDLLVYNVKEKEIFAAEVDDRALNAFFEKNKKNYKWEKPRFKGVKIPCSDKESYEYVKKIVDAISDYKEMEQVLVEEIEKYDSKLALFAHQLVWQEGDDEYIDEVVFKKKHEGNDGLVVLKGRLLDAPEEMDDVRIEVQNDYQASVEKRWMEILRGKYKVEVNEKSLKDLE